MSMTIRLQRRPNQSAGEGSLPPAFEGHELCSWCYHSLVRADAPMGGGDKETGWYAVFEAQVPGFEWLVRAYASCIWYSQSGRENDPDMPEDAEEMMARAALKRLGYRED